MRAERQRCPACLNERKIVGAQWCPCNPAAPFRMVPVSVSRAVNAVIGKPVRVLDRDWVGRRVRLKRTIRTNGGTEFHKGRIMEVYGTWRGLFHLHTLKRDTEGMRDGIRRVGRGALELLEVNGGDE